MVGGGVVEPGRLVSPSSRRAWIEIICARSVRVAASVALLAEGVDRNIKHGFAYFGMITSPSSRRAWIEITTSQLHS